METRKLSGMAKCMLESILIVANERNFQRVSYGTVQKPWA